MTIDQLAPEEPLSAELVFRPQAWEDDYAWLQRAFGEIGPGARTASDRWRVRIEDELKTTLDFKVKPDGTATVWCGMSGYQFHHDPTPKELLEGLAEAYRRERERVEAGSCPTRTGSWKMSPAAPTAARQTLEPSNPVSIATPTEPDEVSGADSLVEAPPPAEDSLTRILLAVLLPRVVQLVLIFVAVTAVTLVLSAVASAVR